MRLLDDPGLEKPVYILSSLTARAERLCLFRGLHCSSSRGSAAEVRGADTSIALGVNPRAPVRNQGGTIAELTGVEWF